MSFRGSQPYSYGFQWKDDAFGLTVCESCVVQGDGDVEKLVAAGGEEDLLGRLSDARWAGSTDTSVMHRSRDCLDVADSHE